MENIISCRNLYKYYYKGQPQEFAALKGVNLDIPEGCLAIIKGRSGSGKTTLLNMMSALDFFDEGNVIFDGEEIGGLSDNEKDVLRRKKIGYVFQSVAIIPVMSAYENVDFALRAAGVKRFLILWDCLIVRSICLRNFPAVRSRELPSQEP